MHLITHTSSRLKQLNAAVMLACLLPSGAYAAALGKLTVLSAIGQPLNAEIELLSVGAQEKQSLAVKLAPQQAFSKASVEFNPALGALQFAIETRGAGQVVHITSAEGFNEPAVDVLLELSGSNTPRAVREYSFLLDPPRAQGNMAQVKADPKPVPALAAKADAKDDAKADAKPDSKAVSKADTKTNSQAESKAAAKSAPKTDTAAVKKPAAKSKSADAKTKANAKPKEYKVKQGDSLSAIANRMRPAGVSLDQMLVALYRANPDAFVGDNMSRMRAGAVLSVPDAAAAGAVDRTEADSVVVAQAQDFNTYRQQLAGHVAGGAAKKGGAATQSAGGKITAKVEERATPAGQAKDKLQLSKAGAGDGMTSEDKIAADKAASEAESRIKDLEKNVNDLQKLLEIKNQNLAELSLKKDAKPDAASAAAKPAAASVAPATAATPGAAATTAPAPAPTPAATPPAAAAAEIPATPAPAADAAPAAAAPAAASADATPPAASDATAPAAAATDSAVNPDAPKSKPVLAPPVPKPDFFEGWRENPMLLPGGGLLALVLLAWAAYRARRNQKADPTDPLAPGDGALAPVPPVPPESPIVPAAEEPVVVPPPVAPAPAAEPEPEPEPEPIPAAPEDVFVPPAEEPIFETPPVADPLFASDETAAVAAAQAEAAEQQAKRDAEEALKIDLSRLEPAQAVAPAAAPALDMSSLDFDLELDPNVKPVVEDTALDIDLAAELAAQPAAKPYEAPAPTPSTPESVTPSFEQPAVLPPAIEGLSLDLNDAEPAKDAAAAAAEDNVAEEEDEDETSSFAKEINTKLDLAAAYQEIGDKDGARELLEEVVKAGNRRQVGQAQEMLAQLT